MSGRSLVGPDHIAHERKNSLNGEVNLKASDSNSKSQLEEEEPYIEKLLKTPIVLNTENYGYYKDDIGIQKQTIIYQNILKQFEMLPPSESNLQLMNEIKEKVKNLVESAKPEVDLQRLNADLLHGSDNTKSIETRLMKNKYRSKVSLTCYAVWTDKSSQSQCDSSFFANLPLVDEVFGLYSPVQSLSLRGLGYIFHNCVLDPNIQKNVTQTKEILYILLRFFDMCCVHLNEGCISIGNPLESFLNKRLPNTGSSGSTPAIASPKTASSKDLATLLINYLPQPFIQNLTSISNAELVQKLDDNFTMFGILMEMYKMHERGFTHLMVDYSRKANLHDASQSFLEELLLYCESEEIIITLCYGYYNSTLYHFEEYNGIDYLELLICLMSHQETVNEDFAMEKVLEVAVGCCTKLGLYRWEYYVGLEENEAERRRKLFWKLFCLEKRFASKHGPSIFNDSSINCLLTSEFREAGFLDHRDFISKVVEVPRSETYDKMNVKDLTFYRNCAVCIIINNFFTNVLYNERFTSIRNTAKSSYLRHMLLIEIDEQLNLALRQVGQVEEQTAKLEEIALSKPDSEVRRGITEEDLLACSECVINSKVYSSFLLSSTLNLYSRLSDDFTQSLQNGKLKPYIDRIKGIWRTISGLIIQLDTDYAVWRVCYGYSIVILINIAGIVFSENFLDIEDVEVTLKVFRRFNNLSIFHDNETNPRLNESQFFKSWCRSFSLISILARMLIVCFMSWKNIKCEQLKTLLEEKVPNEAFLQDLILDSGSYLYKYLLEPVKTSGFHLTVRQMFESDYIFSQKKKGSLFENSNNRYDGEIQLGPDHISRNKLLSCYPNIEGATGTPTPIDQNDGSNLTRISRLLNSHSLGQVPPNSSSNILGCDGEFTAPRNALDKQSTITPPSNNIGNTEEMNNSNNIYPTYNLGTLEEFVNGTDLNDLYMALWKS